MGRPTHSVTAGVWLLVVAAVLSASALAARRPPLPADPSVEALLSQYQELRPKIPVDARVAFVSTGSDAVGHSMTHFLAQYALAPRVVDQAAEGAAFAVSAPAAPPATDSDPRLQGFTLVEVARGGVRLYRRAP